MYIYNATTHMRLYIYLLDASPDCSINLVSNLDPVSSITSHTQSSLSGYVYHANTADTATSATSATSAGKWSSARTLTLTGSVTGSTSFDGSGNMTLTTTTNHNHDSSYVKINGSNATAAGVSAMIN